MGLTDTLRGRRVYLDTNILIYLLEGAKEYETQISELKNSMENGHFEACVSDLVLTEILPPLVEMDDHETIQQIHSQLSDGGAFTRIECGQGVFIQAGILRGRFGLKTPDALHVSFALEGECSVFFTNDKGITCPETIQCVRMSEFHS